MSEGMNLKDIEIIGNVLFRNFKDKCPLCSGKFYIKSIEEYFEVYCLCGFELKMKINEQEV